MLHEEIEEVEVEQGEEEVKHFHELRWLVDVYNQAQKQRLASAGRKRALLQGADEGPEMKFIDEIIDHFAVIESAIASRMKKVMELHPAWPYLKRVKGVGPVLAAKVCGLIPEGFIENAHVVSKLWRFAGQAVIDGKAEKPQKGEQLHYSVRLKTTLYLISGSMIKSKSPYAALYYQAKEYYTANRPEWNKMRIHYASLRRMQRVFLHHLWKTWREALGLEARKLYVHEYLQHTTEHKVEDFISSKIEKNEWEFVAQIQSLIKDNPGKTPDVKAPRSKVTKPKVKAEVEVPTVVTQAESPVPKKRGRPKKQ